MTREQEAYNVSTWKGIYKSNNQKKSFSEGFVAGAEWADQHPKSSWISVEERLPDEGLVIARYNAGLAFSYYMLSKWIVQCAAIGRPRIYETPTHWMPIPELPKGCEQ